MSEETIQTSAESAPRAASNTGGADQGARRPAYSDGGDRAGGGDARPRGRKRRKVSFLTIQKIERVDYKEVPTLRRFINDRGKILSCKHTGNTAKQQRMISEAIRRAREMALLPFVVIEIPPDRPMRPRRDYNGPRDRDGGGGYRGGGDRDGGGGYRGGGDRDSAPRESAPAPAAPTE